MALTEESESRNEYRHHMKLVGLAADLAKGNMDEMGKALAVVNNLDEFGWKYRVAAFLYIVSDRLLNSQLVKLVFGSKLLAEIKEHPISTKVKDAFAVETEKKRAYETARQTIINEFGNDLGESLIKTLEEKKH